MTLSICSYAERLLHVLSSKQPLVRKDKVDEVEEDNDKTHVKKEVGECAADSHINKGRKIDSFKEEVSKWS